MGNSLSSDDTKSPTESASATVQSSHRKEKPREPPQTRLVPKGSQNGPRSHVTNARTQPPQQPTAAFVPTSSTASTSTSNTYAQADISATSASSHSRARSITTGDSKSRAADSRSPMGNAESRQRPPSRSSTLPPPLAADKSAPSPLSQPLVIPQHPTHDGLDDLTPPAPYGLAASDFSRPPRLPLPIERDPEPTSPVITPHDAMTPMDPVDEEDLVARRASMLSSTTLDDEEVPDMETFELEADPYAQKVPTTIRFKGDAKSVFVTGTFARWEKKFRMHKGVDTDGLPLFTWTASLPAGTHHIRFLVDGEMIVSNQYLQTVDFTNSLVNYIEIAAKTPPAEETHVTVPSDPVPIPGAETIVVDDGRSKPIEIPTSEQLPETPGELSSTLEETIPAPSVVEAQPSQPISIRGPQDRQRQQQPEHEQESQPGPRPKKYLPRAKYHSEIPLFLQHIDIPGDQENQDFRRASKAIENLPAPPSLPMFMSKSILNVTTPHKDDASVLTMPNHTVLNHLATSSIKSGVLATSGTTRYKKKFLTTIMYKPTVDEV